MKDWLEEVQQKYKRKNQVLFSKENPILEELSFLASGEAHRALVLWALELAKEDADTLESKYPLDPRPQQAVEASWLWASGEIKMHQAKRAILDCHALAREITCPEDIALCHAVGQGCSVVHTPGHTLGLPLYELTAIVRRLGPESCRDAVEHRAKEYVERLLYWHSHWQEHPEKWAPFLCRPHYEKQKSRS